ncbi:hypothetical protein JTE90_015329 [Oedothorax gibbosus]|uniref:Major facilitator superfamily associated domain-containing protein n=1 Tax=Oedothorax gibbosus TaxID=931172 RepID=A0AAV6U684_9ARAC|nr:hypothetical protein JTE90_015329 [Oedothorax gibbosus]
MKVLIHFLESTKLKILNCGEELPHIVEQTFNLQSEPIQSTQDSVDILPVVSLRCKQWPTVHDSLFDNFSKTLLDALSNRRILSYDERRELVGHLATYAYQFKPYPNKSERIEVCQELASRYPHLRNGIGGGIDGLEIKMLNKIKRIRQGDSSLEVRLNRNVGRVEGKKVPKFENINPKRGELNWAPPHLAGETFQSQEIHRRIMSDECQKEHSSQDRNKISTLMLITYSFRRERINAKIPISDIINEYPALFLYEEQLEEFERLTAVKIKTIFFDSVAVIGPILYDFFKKKKKTAEEKILLKSFEDACDGVDVATSVCKQSEFGIFILPNLLKENPDSFIDLIEYDGHTPEVLSSSPKIIAVGSLLEADYLIICEGEEISRTKSLSRAVCLLISFYYTLNLSFPVEIFNVLKFLQNGVLTIRGGVIPAKVSFQKMDITKNETQQEIYSISSQLPENKKFPTKVRWWHIDREMLRFKLHFFLFIGGLGTSLPYLTVFARDRIGLSASSVASILTPGQFLGVFAKNLLGFLTDYFNRLKAAITILIVLTVVLLFFLLPIPKIRNFQEEESMTKLELYSKKMHNRNTMCNLTKMNISSKNEYYTNLLCSLESYEEDPPECRKAFVTKRNRTLLNSNFPTYEGTHSYNRSDLTSFETEELNFFCSQCCDGTEDCYLISCSKNSKYNEEIKKEFVQFNTYQFWLFTGIVPIAIWCAGALFALSDTACCETVANTSADFGRQRLYGALGFGTMAPIGGLMYDYTDDYLLSWIVMGIMFALCLWNLWKMDLVQPQFSQNILKDVGKVLRNAEFLVFELGVLLNGIGGGMLWVYQVWFLTSIGASSLLCGLVQTVQNFLGVIPFMFYSSWFIKRVGHLNILSLSMAAYCIRFLFYSYLQDPWLTLPMEVVHGITYGLFYATVASYAKLSAKPGTEATTQSILFTTYEGLGSGLGCVVAGLGFDGIGGHQTFFYASIFFGCGMLVNIALTLLNSRQQKSIDETITC